ncbi:MAG: YqaJ viral recombinase family protein, partial [Moraxellaceae bacterium]|nr:YqaJ viral recombinase family protein [Moraxellaceae bacterium]
DAELPQIDPNDDGHPTYWGTLLEPFVAEYYTRHTGHRVRRVHAVLQHPAHPWMLANIDREIIGARDVQLLECKTSGGFGVRLWQDGVPEYVEVQVQHQLAVTGKQAADVCVVLGGQEARIHRIERDDALIAHLIELERRFWQYVETDTPPPADGSDSAAHALQALYPRDRGTSIDLGDEPAMADAFTRLVALRAELTALEQQEAQLKQTLQQRMGEASRACFANGQITWKRTKDAKSIDLGRLARERPELFDTYPMTRPGVRRFLVST